MNEQKGTPNYYGDPGMAVSREYQAQMTGPARTIDPRNVKASESEINRACRLLEGSIERMRLAVDAVVEKTVPITGNMDQAVSNPEEGIDASCSHTAWLGSLYQAANNLAERLERLRANIKF